MNCFQNGVYRFVVNGVNYLNDGAFLTAIQIHSGSGEMTFVFTDSETGKERKREFERAICAPCADTLPEMERTYLYKTGFVELKMKAVGGVMKPFPVRYLSPIQYYNEYGAVKNETIHTQRL